MKFEGEESREQVEGRNMPRTQVLRSKTPSSEKSKTQLLRGWTNIQNFPSFCLETPSSEKKKLWNDRFRVKNVGAGDTNFRPRHW